MKRMHLGFGLFLLIIVSGSFFESPAQQAIPPDLFITLERSICYGSCPDYKLTISADGTVTFEGRQFVKVKGTAKTHVAPKDLLNLISAFDAAEYFSLKDRYTTAADGCPEVWTDNPTAITSIRIQGKSKSITHYYGCHDDQGNPPYPQALTALETKIDQIVDTNRWIK